MHVNHTVCVSCARSSRGRGDVGRDERRLSLAVRRVRECRVRSAGPERRPPRPSPSASARLA